MMMMMMMIVQCDHRGQLHKDKEGHYLPLNGSECDICKLLWFIFVTFVIEPLCFFHCCSLSSTSCYAVMICRT